MLFTNDSSALKPDSAMARAARMPITKIRLVKDSTVEYTAGQADSQLLSFESLQNFFTEAFNGAPTEEMWVIALNSAMRPIGAFCAGSGTTNQCAIYPGEIMRHLLLSCASAFVMCHNHPSGELRPSAQDRELTRAVQAAAQTLQIRCLDHLITDCAGGFFSFCREGLL